MYDCVARVDNTVAHIRRCQALMNSIRTQVRYNASTYENTINAITPTRWLAIKQRQFYSRA